jgi:hypothetical protein
MKLVVTYSYGDGFTWTSYETIPIEYESEKALAADLEKHCKEYIEDCTKEDEFKNTGLFSSNLIEDNRYYAPTIRTIEQWWDEEHA